MPLFPFQSSTTFPNATDKYVDGPHHKKNEMTHSQVYFWIGSLLALKKANIFLWGRGKQSAILHALRTLIRMDLRNMALDGCYVMGEPLVFQQLQPDGS